MAKKKISNVGSQTSDYLDWEIANYVATDLLEKNRYFRGILILLGINCALRFRDLSQLKWSDILKSEEFDLSESKTGKRRVIYINKEAREPLIKAYEVLKLNKRAKFTDYVFRNKIENKPVTIGFAIKEMHRIEKEYILNIQFTTHSLRKTWARRIYEQAPDHKKQQVMILLKEALNHSSVETTYRYIGIRDEEITALYKNLY